MLAPIATFGRTVADAKQLLAQASFVMLAVRIGCKNEDVDFITVDNATLAISLSVRRDSDPLPSELSEGVIGKTLLIGSFDAIRRAEAA